jgi:hypothetical protein
MQIPSAIRLELCLSDRMMIAVQDYGFESRQTGERLNSLERSQCMTEKLQKSMFSIAIVLPNRRSCSSQTRIIVIDSPRTAWEIPW